MPPIVRRAPGGVTEDATYETGMSPFVRHDSAARVAGLAPTPLAVTIRSQVGMPRPAHLALGNVFILAVIHR